MSEISWKDAIIKVLSESRQPMHYRDITEQILSRGLKQTAGATPVATVGAQITASIKHDGGSSPFVKVRRGTFALREAGIPVESVQEKEEKDESDSVIRAFGMYWQRDLVIWKAETRLYGRQQVGSDNVDFCHQKGVYVLYDHHAVIYVGRAFERPIGRRLYEHTLDRVSGRWSRFSWFGICGVSPSGKLIESSVRPSVSAIVATLEAMLIETLEPPQNRRRGDDFTAVEYIQGHDPELRERELQKTLRSIEQKLRESK
jgi:hypothetical protein